MFTVGHMNDIYKIATEVMAILDDSSGNLYAIHTFILLCWYTDTRIFFLRCEFHQTG